MVVCREEQCRTAGVDRPGDSNELSVSRVRLVASIVYGLIVIPTLIGGVPYYNYGIIYPKTLS